MSLKKLSASSGNSDPIAAFTGTGKANTHRLSLEDAAVQLQRAARVALRKRPIPDIRHAFRFLRSQPTKLPFVACAAFRQKAMTGERDEADIRILSFAGAAYFRKRGRFAAATQLNSLNQSLDEANRC